MNLTVKPPVIYDQITGNQKAAVKHRFHCKLVVAFFLETAFFN